MVCVRLTSSHRRDRREWATEHVNWRRNEWSNVLFSDEFRFSVHPDNMRIFIWRDRGNPCIIRDGPLTARRYRDEILRLIVVPYAAFTCRNCGGGDRGCDAIYRPFGKFRRAKIALSPVWCSRPTTGVPLAHATMNFVGLDLTTSDRWHQKTTTGMK
ncbi:transposable element Tcb2 transposase [Trichonephila clavipes]|nr:transposable element Tcb2 transposase [Trichonephila clavipes]